MNSCRMTNVEGMTKDEYQVVQIDESEGKKCFSPDKFGQKRTRAVFPRNSAMRKSTATAVSMRNQMESRENSGKTAENLPKSEDLSGKISEPKSMNHQEHDEHKEEAVVKGRWGKGK